MKANAATEDISVILMTGSPPEEDERRAATAGASAYLLKGERTKAAYGVRRVLAAFRRRLVAVANR